VVNSYLEKKAMAKSAANGGGFDTDKFINPSQVGGIDAYAIDEGAGRGVRAMCVNTGGGLRYRVLVDRGLDIDQAFYNQHSLSFLAHKDVTPPTRGLDRGVDWLKSFFGGLLTTCGPFNAGGPSNDAGAELGLHGVHSNTAATIESVLQPDPRRGQKDMIIVGRIRYGAVFGPCVELRRTIRSTLGENVIAFTDEFYNAGNTDAPHAWLLHINFGYPLVDEGAELCFDTPRVDGRRGGNDQQNLKGSPRERICPGPLESHVGTNELFGYIHPRPIDRSGRATVAIVNRKLGAGVAIHYNTKEFPRCGNWQHWGPGEYVTALEPMNCGVEGRHVDRERGWLDSIKPGQRKTYNYQIEVVTGRDRLDGLRRLNK
jgi:hypothetical protein